jgi:multidrug efflux system outer membrane protein
MAPKYTRPDMPAPAAWPEGAAYKAADVKKKAPLATEIGWREFIIDGKLRQVIELALANNRDLRVAALNVDKIRGQYQIAMSYLVPHVDGSASRTDQQVARDMSTTGKEHFGRSYSVGLGVAAYELDLFGRVRSMKDQALEQYFATEEARKSAQISLVAEVANAYMTVAAYQELLKLAQDTLNTQEETYKLIQRRYEAGITSELDLKQAQTRLDSARVDIAKYRRDAAIAENALNVLVGTPVPEKLLAKEFGSIKVMKEISPGMPSEVLLKRPDILQAEHMLKSANANIGAARAAFFPRITLTANAGYASAKLTDLFTPYNHAWNFTPQVTMPIFDGGVNIANLKVAKTDKEIMLAQYEKAIQEAFKEVANALAIHGTVGEQLSAQQSLTEATEQAYKLSDARYKAGIDSYLTLLDAQRSLYGAQQALITVRLLRMTNYVTLYKALGGGFDNPVKEEAPKSGGEGASASVDKPA